MSEPLATCTSKGAYVIFTNSVKKVVRLPVCVNLGRVAATSVFGLYPKSSRPPTNRTIK